MGGGGLFVEAQGRDLVVGACITQKHVDARGGKCYLRVVVASPFEFIFYRLQQRVSVS